MIDDTDRIMQVMKSAFDPAFGEAWNLRQLSSSLLMPTINYDLVGPAGGQPCDDDQTAGFTLTRAAPGEEELLLIAVQPQFRGLGLGRILLSNFIVVARNRGADRVFLEMRANNPAEYLYRALGFEPIGRRRDYYSMTDGTRIDAVTFGRSI